MRTYVVYMPTTQQPQRLRGVAGPRVRKLDRPSVHVVPRRLHLDLFNIQSRGRQRLHFERIIMWNRGERLGSASADSPWGLKLGETDHARRPVLGQADERIRAALPGSVPFVAFVVEGAHRLGTLLNVAVANIELGVAAAEGWSKGDEATSFRRRWRGAQRRRYGVCHRPW